QEHWHLPQLPHRQGGRSACGSRVRGHRFAPRRPRRALWAARSPAHKARLLPHPGACSQDQAGCSQVPKQNSHKKHKKTRKEENKESGGQGKPPINPGGRCSHLFVPFCVFCDYSFFVLSRRTTLGRCLSAAVRENNSVSPNPP